MMHNHHNILSIRTRIANPKPYNSNKDSYCTRSSLDFHPVRLFMLAKIFTFSFIMYQTPDTIRVGEATRLVKRPCSAISSWEGGCIRISFRLDDERHDHHHKQRGAPHDRTPEKGCAAQTTSPHPQQYSLSCKAKVRQNETL